MRFHPHKFPSDSGDEAIDQSPSDLNCTLLGGQSRLAIRAEEGTKSSLQVAS